MKHIWIGGVAPKVRFEELMEIGDNQFAANNVQLLYIEGIEKVIGKKMEIISSHFIPDFSKNKILHFKKNKYDNFTEIGFINLPIFKQITKLINVSKEVKRIINDNLNEELIFYIYSMTTPIMYSAKTIRKLSKKKKLNKIKIVQIIPDLPQYMNFEKRNFLWKFAKKIDIKVLYKLLNYIDKYIIFSKYMLEKLNVKKENVMVVEGLIDYNYKIEKNITKENIIMYAGGINKDYGVYDLIDSFVSANIKDYELHLYGPVSNELDLRNKISPYKNIKYFGCVSRDKILELEKKSMLLINPRKPEKEFTKYSFPSKTMEYLMSGTPLLMYKLKSIPREYDNYIFYINNTNKDILKNELIKVCSIKKNDLINKGKLAQKFICENKNNIVQCNKIIKFILD